ncbi:Protein spt10 [Taxawa tesnikishii (nom. ined.)]|nr:Protein spt10 [Dothideales sp. JES 119]
MPAMLDDPTAPVIYRVSGQPPYPSPDSNGLPADIVPRQVTLRDRTTIATLMPFSSPNQVPKTLLTYLCSVLNREIEKGDTYPMVDGLPLESFGPYWFANFGAVMLLGDIKEVEDVWQMERDAKDWSKECLGTFYIKPNYPGRSSHVCNGGFLVTDVSRNRGVGRLMGEGYIEWAPKLVSQSLSSTVPETLTRYLQGYTYSVFNLVYETNVVSLRIWDALGFKRIGRVPGCGNLKSSPDALVDAIIFGRDLTVGPDDDQDSKRFDNIRYYLQTGNYPAGADRAEKSRLRSASTHYRFIEATEDEPAKLMLKDKEVISDPNRQYEIAKNTHAECHAGINKTTASIADRYHWVRIKETVAVAIRNCSECKSAVQRERERELKTSSKGRGKRAASTSIKPDSSRPLSSKRVSPSEDASSPTSTPTITRINSLPSQPASPSPAQSSHHAQPQAPQAPMHPFARSSQQQAHHIPVADQHAYQAYTLDPQLMDNGSAPQLLNDLHFDYDPRQAPHHHLPQYQHSTLHGRLIPAPGYQQQHAAEGMDGLERAAGGGAEDGEEAFEGEDQEEQRLHRQLTTELNQATYGRARSWDAKPSSTSH